MNTEWTTEVVGAQTWATITFSGPFVVSGNLSLIDGDYQLVVDGAHIRRAGSSELLDADNNGIAGGSRIFGAESLDAFYRLFGDIDGDRDVDMIDRSIFQQSYGSILGSLEYDSRFDFDGDGDIDAIDRRQFRRNFARPQPAPLLPQTDEETSQSNSV